MVSWTVTVKLSGPVLLAASVAVQVTVVVLRANCEPLAAEQVGVIEMSKESVAVAAV